MNLEPVNVGLKNAAWVPSRAVLGASMLYHGATKLSAEGHQKTTQMMGGLGIKPPKLWALLTAGAEVLAGATTIAGIGTRVGALAVLATQTVAIWKVHFNKGFENMKGGYEYNLALIAMAAGLLIAGPGVLSAHELVEHRLEKRARRRAWIFGPKKSLRLVKLLK